MVEDAGTRRKPTFQYARNELEMFYQPKISLAENKIIGAEALLRVRKSWDTVYAPAAFLCDMERRGESNTLDWFVFREVCGHLKTLMERGISLPISVNFSRQSIESPKFAGLLESVADQYGIPHALIDVEVTEGILEERPEVMRNMLKRVHGAGFGISVDDFGKGYSSLGFVKDVEFDTLKIDMGFLRDFEKAESKAVIDCVIELGKRLNKRVVSEGVETGEQAEYLFIKGCGVVQGYYFAKPMPLTELIRFVRVYPDGQDWTERKKKI